jgi:pimeloyl-ACP methyl ester carboxylesterase
MAQIVMEPFKFIVSATQIFPSPPFLYFHLRLMALWICTVTNGTSRRVCIHDPLGFGWSQDPFDGQFTNYEYLYRLMLSSNESMPWHIVGWGGGGSAIMYLANNHTSSIQSVTFVETYPPGIEFSYYGYQNEPFWSIVLHKFPLVLG